MNSDNLSWIGYSLIVIGSVLVGGAGLFFYNYFQDAIASGLSGTSTTTTAALNTLNGTANAPVFVTIAIFGLAFLIMGAVFVTGSHVGEKLSRRTFDQPHLEQEAYVPKPTRACTKCGILLYQNTAYCPNCGNPILKAPNAPLTA